MENNNKHQLSSSSSSYPPKNSFQNLIHEHQRKIQMFLNHQRQEIEQINDFRNHQLPLARIKKIMKADEDVRMISAEAPILFSKACELFILELTIRSWLNAEENKRRTLQKNDISAAISRTDIFDFLVDIVPRREDEVVAIGQPALGGIIDGGGVYIHPPPSQAWQSVWQNDGGSYGSPSGQADHGNLNGLGYVNNHPSSSL